MKTKTYSDKIFFLTFFISSLIWLGFTGNGILEHYDYMETTSLLSEILRALWLKIPIVLIAISILLKNKKIGISGVVLGFIISIEKFINSILTMNSFMNFLPGYNTETISNCISVFTSVIVFALLLAMVYAKNRGILFGILAGVVDFVVSGIFCIHTFIFYKVDAGFLLRVVYVVIHLVMYCSLSYAWENIFKKEVSDQKETTL